MERMQRPVFYLKHNVSETRFCFCLQVSETETSLPIAHNWVGPPEEGGWILSKKLCLKETGPNKNKSNQVSPDTIIVIMKINF
jgi:hypothetical protein